MKLIIDINEIAYKNATHIPSIDWNGNLLRIVNDALQNGTPIPSNATNGDVLSSIFNIDIKNKLVHDDITAYEITVDLGTNWTTLRINKDWWNASYQKGGKE